MNKAHSKHAKIPRSRIGEWGRNELSILGTSCDVISALALNIAKELRKSWKIAYVDADHAAASKPDDDVALAIRYSDRITSNSIDIKDRLSLYQKHQLFNACDLVVVNGNHFSAQQQIVVVDADKKLAGKLDKLSDVRLVLLMDGVADVPEYLKGVVGEAAVMRLSDIERIVMAVAGYMRQAIAPLNGLVLAGGQSMRMGKDKGLLDYHGKTQREHVYELLQPMCSEVYISCNAGQAEGIELPKIMDQFVGLGPLGGILSAFQSAPDNAWLSVACDLPYVSEATLKYLVRRRNPSKLATAFVDSTVEFPEPLITIWEPRAYPILLQALSEGYSCPRKVLINSDIELLEAPNVDELKNVNDVDEYEEVTAELRRKALNTPVAESK